MTDQGLAIGVSLLFGVAAIASVVFAIRWANYQLTGRA